MLKCKINGHELEVPEGTSIIQAFQKLEQDIAHYCYHPGLSVAGVCRLCMVEVEGQPKLQIACNTQVTDGMVITNQSAKVKEAVKWGLDFHLVNHPLDCPICDQAGECELQEQYMKFGQYDSEMAEAKVKKKKAVDIGPRVKLDSERCILCSRCVRFTSEVSRTHELGILKRGDRSEIGCPEGVELDNNYSVNTVDICPVGALTSKDFRFQQRVWFLKEAPSICNGCSTGCNTKVSFNNEGFYRVRPRYNADVNGHWMCDEGRDTYKAANPDQRLAQVVKGSEVLYKERPLYVALKNTWESVTSSLGLLKPEDRVRVVVTPQMTNQEYRALVQWVQSVQYKVEVFVWDPTKNDEMNAFDGLLKRGDRNSNRSGMLKELAPLSLQTIQGSLSSVLNKEVAIGFVFAPEVSGDYGLDSLKTFEGLDTAAPIYWMTTAPCDELGHCSSVTQIPVLSHFEKFGSYLNYEGREQNFSAVSQMVVGAVNVVSLLEELAASVVREENGPQAPIAASEMATPEPGAMVAGKEVSVKMGALETDGKPPKKNEFIQKGSVV